MNVVILIGDIVQEADAVKFVTITYPNIFWYVAYLGSLTDRS